MSRYILHNSLLFSTRVGTRQLRVHVSELWRSDSNIKDVMACTALYGVARCIVAKIPVSAKNCWYYPLENSPNVDSKYFTLAVKQFP